MICISDIVYKQSASVSKKIYFIQRKTWPHSSNFLLSIPIIQASANKVLFSENVIRDEQKMNPIR